MEVWLVFFLFLFGLCIGSFLNVLIDRLPKGESVLKGRSYCESCRKNLAWYDLIPLISFVVLRGRCRYCKFPISFYYPLVELTTGVLFTATFLFLENKEGIRNYELGIMNIELIYYLLIIASLIVIFFTDLKYGIIPDKVVYPAILVGFIFSLAFTSEESWLPQLSWVSLPPSEVGSTFNFVASAFGAFFLFLLLYVATKGKGMGFGDVKLAFLMGLVLGFPKIIFALYIAFLTGALLSLILVLCRRKGLKDTVPFGPYLVLATLALLFFGDLISNSFLSVLR